MRILLVEDDEFDALRVRRYLRRSRLAEPEVELVTSLSAARERMSGRAFDVVLLDLNLPDSGGPATVCALAGHDTPIVVLTGATEADVAAGAGPAGSPDTLFKSGMNADVLERTIRHAVERHALLRDTRRAVDRERLLRDLIERMSEAESADDVIRQTVLLLPGAPEIQGATFFRRQGEGRFEGTDQPGPSVETDDEAGDVFELVLAGDSPLEPGMGPGALADAWLVPVQRDGTQFGVLAVRPTPGAAREPVADLLHSVVRVLLVAMARARREEDLRRTGAAADRIASYVPREVLRDIGQNPDAAIVPGGVRRRALVMFVDLSGFSRLAEQLAPERVVELLNRYFEQLHSIVIRHGGVIDKHIGDAALLVFHARPEEGDRELCRRACAAAAALLEHFGPTANHTVHIGAAFGDVVVGNVGSPHRYERTVIGDTVNLAARLQELAPAGAMAVDDFTERSLRGAGRLPTLVVQSRRSSPIRGRTGRIPVTVFVHSSDAGIGAAD